MSTEDLSLQPVLSSIELALTQLQGELTRIVYLSTLRDYNTGAYFHPQLSEMYGIERADRALAMYHKNLFMQLLKAPVREYVEELRVYMRVSNVNIITPWRSLEPYRSTIPSGVPKFLADVYSHNIEQALLILQNAPPGIWEKR
jgi:hypothetical protein